MIGIKQLGIPKYQNGTTRGGLVNLQYSGLWGNRGKGNELQSALENGLSWIGDKVVNFGDYVDDGLAYLTGLLPGGQTPELAVLTSRNERVTKPGEPYKIEGFNTYGIKPITGDVPIIPTYKINLSRIPDEVWDLAYESALREKDVEKIKKLRSLHFLIKSGNDALVFAHSTNSTFNVFDRNLFGKTDEGFHGKGFYFTTTRIPENGKLYKIPKGPSGEIPGMNYGRKKYYVYLKGERQYDVSNPSRNFFEEPNSVGFVSPKDSKLASEVIVGQPTLIKSARGITFDDNGNFIPLSKRDNFTNPDWRYLNGGILYKFSFN